MSKKSQKGDATALILIAGLGLILFLLIAASTQFRDNFFSRLFPKYQTEASGYQIVVYYPSWGTYDRNYQIADIDGLKVTRINYAFANISNGEVVLGDSYADTDKAFDGDCFNVGCKRGNFNQLTKLKQQYPNVKTLISVGGWTWSAGFSDAALTQVSRDKFADSAVKFIRDWGFDGVDIDWEYPVGGGLQNGRAEDKANYTFLLQTLRNKLDEAGSVDGKQYLLTAAVGATALFAQNTEISSFTQYLDTVNLMTYDFHGSWENVSGHNAPLFRDSADTSALAASLNIDAAVTRFLSAGVPASKMVLGLPFYGKGWSGCAVTRYGEYQACSSIPTGTTEGGFFDFSDLEANYINKNGYYRYMNSESKVPFLFNLSNGTFISYDDEESIGYKLDYLKIKGMGGAMAWDLSGDRNETLLNKVAAELTGEVPTPTSSPTTATFIPGDINRNHRVDIFDFNLLITDFGKTDATSLRSDVNHNGRVDVFDFNLLITNFGKSN